MEALLSLEGNETEILQIGVVVKDLEKTIEFLTSLGLGPFVTRRATHPAAQVRGKKVSYEVGLALSQQGNIQLELIEYVNGDTIHEEFLSERGEGLHHILFKVKDLDSSIEKFRQKGVEVLQEDRWVEGGGIAYMSTDTIGGIIFELVQRPPDYDPAKGAHYRNE